MRPRLALIPVLSFRNNVLLGLSGIPTVEVHCIHIGSAWASLTEI